VVTVTPLCETSEGGALGAAVAAAVAELVQRPEYATRGATPPPLGCADSFDRLRLAFEDVVALAAQAQQARAEVAAGGDVWRALRLLVALAERHQGACEAMLAAERVLRPKLSQPAAKALRVALRARTAPLGDAGDCGHLGRLGRLAR